MFTEGAIVYLKTGSPPLVVENTRRDGLIGVVWFNGLSCLRTMFHPDALTDKAPC
jgi:uncharacterized protein YodC (DUF2158 family)